MNHYFCLFDATSGECQGCYIQEYQTVPPEAVELSKNDFVLVSRDHNWVYNWDTKTIEYKTWLQRASLVELRCRAQEIVREETRAKILAGFVVKLKDSYIIFNCELEDQINLNTYYNESIDNPDRTWQLRGRYQKNPERHLFTLNAEEVKLVQNACAKYIDEIRRDGWKEQEYVTSQERTPEELQNYIVKHRGTE